MHVQSIGNLLGSIGLLCWVVGVYVFSFRDEFTTKLFHKSPLLRFKSSIFHSIKDFCLSLSLSFDFIRTNLNLFERDCCPNVGQNNFRISLMREVDKISFDSRTRKSIYLISIEN